MIVPAGHTSPAGAKAAGLRRADPETRSIHPKEGEVMEFIKSSYSGHGDEQGGGNCVEVGVSWNAETSA